jgi:c-di-GMP-binding flagellar brake protein YcgR
MQLPDELFEAIVGCGSISVDSGRSSERRNDGRVRLPARVQIIPMSQQDRKPVSVQVRDLSQQGVGLLVPKKLSQGDTLLVHLQGKEVSAWVLSTVARVERVAEGLYVVGAVFIRLVEPNKSPALAVAK